MIDEKQLTNQVMTAPTTHTWVYDFHTHHPKLVHYVLNELKPHDVKVQILYSSINRNDLSYAAGCHKHDWFGSEAIGKIVAVGKEVKERKAGDTVGVVFQNHDVKNHSGFTQFLQINENQIVDIPAGLPIEKATSLLTTGVFAFNACEKVEKGTHVAIIGHGNLASLATKFAKKQFGLQVTLFAPAGHQNTAKECGADHFQVRSVENFKKLYEKYSSIIVADVLDASEVAPAMAAVKKGGKLIIAISQTHDLVIVIMDLVTNQKQIYGVKRSTKQQHIRVLKSASTHGIIPNVESFEFKDFDKALQKSKLSSCSTVIHVV